jgi:hypothetical protein
MPTPKHEREELTSWFIVSQDERDPNELSRSCITKFISCSSFIANEYSGGINNRCSFVNIWCHADELQGLPHIQ